MAVQQTTSAVFYAFFGNVNTKEIVISFNNHPNCLLIFVKPKIWHYRFLSLNLRCEENKSSHSEYKKNTNFQDHLYVVVEKP